MRSVFIAAGICLSMIGSCFGQTSIATIARIETRIPPQPLESALKQFTKLDHIQVLYLTAAVKGLRTSGASGRLTADETLTRLLSGTGLTYRYVEVNAVSIVPTGHSVSAPLGVSSTAKARGVSTSTHERTTGPAHESPDPPTDAPEAGNNAVSPLEVVITAQKYRQSAFDVPLSLNVVASEDLQQLGISSLNDLQYAVPGLYVEGGNAFNYIVLRGVSNSAGNGALVGEYIDEADVSASGFIGQVGYGAGDVGMYDLSRVEVLKGPQGTLYGDGALGGVIRYITNPPALDQYELGSDVSALFTQDGAPSQRIEAMFNAPLIAGTLGLRMAGQFFHDGGWADEPAADVKNFNSVNITDVRIEGLWRPNTSFSARATQIVRRESYGIGAGEDTLGNVTLPYGDALQPQGEESFNLSNITVTAEFRNAELLSATSYATHAETLQNTFTISPGFLSLVPYQPLTNHTFSEEMRAHGRTSDRWEWTVGAFYKHFLETYGVSEYFGSEGPLSSATSYSSFGDWDHSASAAVFVDTSVKLTGRLIVGGGARYFRDSFSSASQTTFLDGAPTFPAEFAKQDFTSTDPRVFIQYHAATQANIYASAAKGFRSGEPNLGLGEGLGFNPEGLWSYDLGSKYRFLNGRIRTNADVFYEKYSNYVSNGLISVDGVPLYGSFNIGSARIKGADADFSMRLNDNWRFSAKGEAVDSRFVSVTAQETGFEAGQMLPFVPPFTFMVSGEHEFRLGIKPAFALISYSQTARVHGFSSPLVDSDVIRLLNFKLGVRWRPNARLTVFVNNLLNDRGYLDPNSQIGNAYRARPRTVGAEFTVAPD